MFRGRVDAQQVGNDVPFEALAPYLCVLAGEALLVVDHAPYTGIKVLARLVYIRGPQRRGPERRTPLLYGTLHRCGVHG